MFLDLRRLLELLESSVQKGFGRLFSGPLSMELKTEHFGPRVFGQLGQAWSLDVLTLFIWSP